MDNAVTFITGWIAGILFGVCVLGILRGCNYFHKPCDNCGLKAEQYMNMNLKLCPVCAGKLYELKNKKTEETGK